MLKIYILSHRETSVVVECQLDHFLALTILHRTQCLTFQNNQSTLRWELVRIISVFARNLPRNLLMDIHNCNHHFFHKILTVSNHKHSTRRPRNSHP